MCIVKLVSFADYQDEIVSMMMDMRHLEPQIVDIPIARYIDLQEMGVLKPFLWFDDDEAIKGVALLFVGPSLRNNAIINASTDVIWVKPEYRGGSKIFVDGIKQQLQKMGVTYWCVSSRDSQPIDRFLIKNNFNPLEWVFYCEV